MLYVCLINFSLLKGSDIGLLVKKILQTLASLASKKYFFFNLSHYKSYPEREKYHWRHLTKSAGGQFACPSYHALNIITLLCKHYYRKPYPKRLTTAGYVLSPPAQNGAGGDRYNGHYCRFVTQPGGDRRYEPAVM